MLAADFWNNPHPHNAKWRSARSMYRLIRCPSNVDLSSLQLMLFADSSHELHIIHRCMILRGLRGLCVLRMLRYHQNASILICIWTRCISYIAWKYYHRILPSCPGTNLSLPLHCESGCTYMAVWLNLYSDIIVLKMDFRDRTTKATVKWLTGQIATTSF